MTDLFYHAQFTVVVVTKATMSASDVSTRMLAQVTAISTVRSDVANTQSAVMGPNDATAHRSRVLTSIRRDAENPWTGDGADVLAEHMTAILASVPATHSLSIVIAQAMQSFVADEEAKVKARAQAHSAPLATSLMSASNGGNALAYVLTH